MGELVKFPVRGERWLTKAELAEEIGYAERTINAWMREGMPHIKRGSAPQASVRFVLSEVRAWMMRRSA